MHYVYQYFDPLRNEIIYIGKGTGRRAYHHLKRKDRHPLTQRLGYMKDRGADPIISIFPREDELSSLNEEIRLIAVIGRKDLGLGPLLNLTDGGEGVNGRIISEETLKKVKGRPLSDDHKRAISEARKGQAGHALSEEHKQAIGKAHTGKPVIHTEQTRKKMRESKLGRKRKPFTEETKQRMREASRQRWEKTEIDK